LSRTWPIGQSLPRLSDSLLIRIEIFDAFSKVEPIWRKAQERCACYGFQTFEWLSTWQETIGVAEKVEPYIVHIADTNATTLMLLPLGIQRRYGVALLKFLGDDVTDYHAPIVRPDFAAQLRCAELNRLMSCVIELLPEVDVVALEKMPSVIEGVRNPLASLSGAEHQYNGHAATLGDTFKGFKERRSTKFFSTSARKWRRLSEIAPAKFCIARSPDTADEFVRVLVRQKRRRYLETGSPDPLSKPHFRSFYLTLAKKYASKDLIQISALRVGSAIVATHLGMVFRGRFYWLFPSFEAGSWARYSPGGLLMQILVEHSISEGLKTFDLTIGDEAYKKLWGDHILPLYDCVRGASTKGKAYVWARLAVKRIRQRAKQSNSLLTLVRAFRRRQGAVANLLCR
jgi:CelD/BcsL family acetyltransferase involved in cellulose biosynthesis